MTFSPKPSALSATLFYILLTFDEAKRDYIREVQDSNPDCNRLNSQVSLTTEVPGQYLKPLTFFCTPPLTT